MNTALKPITRHHTIVLLTLLLTACSEAQPPVATSPSPLPASSPTVVPAPSPVAPSPAPNALGDPFQKGIDKATSATVLSRDAQTQDDWSLVATQWQRAIDFMDQVPRNHRNYRAARRLQADYRVQLTRAQQMVKRGGGRLTRPTASASSKGGIPLIEAEDNTDAVGTVNAMNQQQVDFFTRQKRFAANLAELGSTTVKETPSYLFYSSGSQSGQAVSGATPKRTGLPAYVGAVFLIKQGNNQVPITAVCVANQPAKAALPPPTLNGQEIQCPPGTSKV